MRPSRSGDAGPEPWFLAAEILVVAGALAVLLERASAPLSAGRYAPWDGRLTALASFARWFLSATTEPNFYTCALSGVGLLAGGAFAHRLSRERRRGQGFGLACGSGIWPAVVTSALL